MTEPRARLLIELARTRRPAAARHVAFRGCRGAGRTDRDRVGRPGGLGRGTRPEGLASRAGPGLARARRELHRGLVGQGRSDRPPPSGLPAHAPLRERLDAWARRARPILTGRKWVRPPSKSDDRRNIAAHYDLSNQLFSLMLDPTMAYSCAYFSDSATTLEDAQVASRRIADKLGLGPEDHVVEIGTAGAGRDPGRRAPRLPRHHDHDLRGPALVCRAARRGARARRPGDRPRGRLSGSRGGTTRWSPSR